MHTQVYISLMHRCMCNVAFVVRGLIYTQPNSAQGIIQESFTTTGESQYTHHLSVLSTQNTDKFPNTQQLVTYTQSRLLSHQFSLDGSMTLHMYTIQPRPVRQMQSAYCPSHSCICVSYVYTTQCLVQEYEASYILFSPCITKQFHRVTSRSDSKQSTTGSIVVALVCVYHLTPFLSPCHML